METNPESNLKHKSIARLEATAADRDVLEILLTDLVSEDNMRGQDNEQDVQTLMCSMAKEGLLQPIGVIPSSRGKYRIIFGNRRKNAAKKLGWLTIRATVFQELDETNLKFMHLNEGIQQKSFTLPEIGAVLTELIEGEQLSLSEVVARTGYSRDRIVSILKIYKSVPKDLQYKVNLNRQGGPVKRNISRSTITAIATLAKSQGMSQAEARQIYDLASKNKNITTGMMGILATQLKNGMPIDKAIEHLGKIRRVQIQLFVYDVELADLSEATEKKDYIAMKDLILDSKYFKRSRSLNRGVNK